MIYAWILVDQFRSCQGLSLIANVAMSVGLLMNPIGKAVWKTCDRILMKAA
jgi:hypothetical protein